MSVRLATYADIQRGGFFHLDVLDPSTVITLFPGPEGYVDTVSLVHGNGVFRSTRTGHCVLAKEPQSGLTMLRGPPVTVSTLESFDIGSGRVETDIRGKNTIFAGYRLDIDSPLIEVAQIRLDSDYRIVFRDTTGPNAEMRYKSAAGNTIIVPSSDIGATTMGIFGGVSDGTALERCQVRTLHEEPQLSVLTGPLPVEVAGTAFLLTDLVSPDQALHPGAYSWMDTFFGWTGEELSEDELLAVEGIRAWNPGIPGGVEGLRAGHPYKNAPPVVETVVTGASRMRLATSVEVGLVLSVYGASFADGAIQPSGGRFIHDLAHGPAHT